MYEYISINTYYFLKDCHKDRMIKNSVADPLEIQFFQIIPSTVNARITLSYSVYIDHRVV